jgi:hypothetical protein
MVECPLIPLGRDMVECGALGVCVAAGLETVGFDAAKLNRQSDEATTTAISKR